MVDPLVISGLGAVLGLIAWGYRSLADDELDPLILSLTLFAFVSQIGVLAQEVGEVLDAWLVASTFGVLLLAAAQIFVFRDQRSTTRQHIRQKLGEIGEGTDSGVIEYWAETAIEIAGVDFFPQFYDSIGGGNPRASRRNRFIELLPDQHFAPDRLREVDLLVPKTQRRWRWRAYVFFFLASWTIHLLYAAIGA